MNCIKCPFCYARIEVGVQADPKILTSEQVASRLGVGVKTIWRMVASGKFPQPVRYNRKLVRWKAEDIDEYVRSLA